MVEGSGLMFLRYLYDRGGIFVIRDADVGHPHIAIAAVGECLAGTPTVVALRFITRDHLRMVHGQMLVKHKDVLMLSQRHTVGVQVSAGSVLVPDKVIPPHPWLGHEQFGRKHTLSEKYDGTVRFDNVN